MKTGSEVDIDIFGALVDAGADLLKQNRVLQTRVEELEAMLNTPELHDFVKGVVIEAAHQRERWPAGHDACKSGSDWIRLCVHLLGKLSKADWAGDLDKLLHHQITLAAVLNNFHAAALIAKARKELP